MHLLASLALSIPAHVCTLFRGLLLVVRRGWPCVASMLPASLFVSGVPWDRLQRVFLTYFVHLSCCGFPGQKTLSGCC